MEKIIFFLIFTFSIFSNNCYTQNDTSSNNIWDQIKNTDISENNSGPLDIINRRDTLIIKYQHTECGEWGGHWEIIYLQRDSLGNIKARFTKDKVPCEIIVKNGISMVNDEKRVMVQDTIIFLNIEDEKLLLDFLTGVFENYLKDYFFPFGKASYFLIRNTDNSMGIYYHNNGTIVNSLYRKFRNSILY